ncbi:hypothetical protein GCM10010400_38540 [Streptomyces aculeolatus]|uniref:hypothetical protein n=1 Tax=Streptomyces aculeolatus TaxID=270689 RepID=UPI001CEE01B4|nr:hypothetical protein [Streptomyces aculeolatus]
MRTHARMAKALGAALATAGLLLAGSPAADAADTTAPKPPPINLLDATVAGCQAPCAPDESGVVSLKFERPVRPDSIPAGAFKHIRIEADGVGVHYWSWNDTGDPWVYNVRVCASEDFGSGGCSYQYQLDKVRGAEKFTVRIGYMYNCSDDPISPTCESSQMSDPSNALVPRQL